MLHLDGRSHFINVLHFILNDFLKNFIGQRNCSVVRTVTYPLKAKLVADSR